MSEIEDPIVDLKVAQARTHAVVERLSDEVQQYIEVDQTWHRDLDSSHLETVKLLAEVASTLKDVKVGHDKLASEVVPNLGNKVASLESSRRTHGWFIKSLMALTVIASLGGLIGGVNSCQTGAANASDQGMNQSRPAQVHHGRKTGR